MSLRTKILVIIASIVALYGSVDYAVQRMVIYPSFVGLERNEAEKDLQRCMEAIQREVQQVSTTCADYAAWNDTCDFVANSTKRYIEVNMVLTNLKNLGVNLMYVCNPQGTVVASCAFDLSEGQPIEVPDLPKDRFPTSNILMAHKDTKDAVAGILATRQGPLILASRPILNDNREGPIRGAVIMGRFLNKEALDKLRAQTCVSFDIESGLAGEGTPGSGARPGASPSASTVRIDDSRADVLRVSSTVIDIFGKPAFPIEAVVPREITAKGRAATQYAGYSVVAIGLVVLLTLLASLQWTVLGPLSRLTRHVVQVGQSDDLTARFSMKTGGEIGTLAAEFDRMVERLADARKRLLEQSYESGIAEMASGTLHNVRNALTPVLVEMDMLRQELASTPLDQIEMARKQLADESLTDSRRQDLSRFLELANGRLAAVTRETRTKLDDVMGRARQIEEFISDQDAVSRADRPAEWVTVSGVLQEAMALLSPALRENISVETGSGVAQVGSFKVPRICLVQVLGNLLTNAAEAIVSAGKDRGNVWCDACVEEANGATMIHLQVRDDGNGIAAENLSRVFERGVSTKEGDHKGFGLHWCANTVAALRGQMYAESDGIGRGACVHVLVPKSS